MGTYSANEAKEYFENMTRHRIRFDYAGDEDDRSIIIAFSPDCFEKRKDWLKDYMDEKRRRKEIGLGEKYLYQKNTKSVTYSDFVNVELARFFSYNNIRSIPIMIDGFKPVQRKVLYTCLKRNDKLEVTVVKLACSVAERTAYRDDESSLMSTIINLARNFVGRNNINLLQPIGQFGSRLLGGEDCASPEYLYTRLKYVEYVEFRNKGQRPPFLLPEFEPELRKILENTEYTKYFLYLKYIYKYFVQVLLYVLSRTTQNIKT